ncbi:MAG: NAD+ synthase [Spirochaetales bacterium]|nr:NAD+ synthase [Spirochaetales bacterium]
MKIAIGQINAKIADFDGNKKKILDFAQRAEKQKADIIIFPELSVCGYPPLDLLTYHYFVDRNLQAVDELCRELPRDIAVSLGYVDKNTSGIGKPLYNMTALIKNGAMVYKQAKSLLPTYDVFDEDRYFEPADRREPFPFQGSSLGFVICEDIWVENAGDLSMTYPINPADEMVNKGADLLISVSASPFHIGRVEERKALLRDLSRQYHIPAIYVNAVGANDSLIFDGNSMAVDADGDVVLKCASFSEDLCFAELSPVGMSAAEQDTADAEEIDAEEGGSELAGAGSIPEALDRTAKIEDGGIRNTDDSADSSEQDLIYENLEKALILGVGDYLRKSGFSRVNLGLSGGIDSALTAVIAAKTVGPENVHAYAMPSRYSSEHSLTDARQLAENLGIGYEEIPIESCFSAALESLSGSFAGTEPDVTEENIQARIRGMLLMAWSNKRGSLLLTTGNKSEMAVGYCTLYGDMSGSLAVIGDLFKSEVFALCRSINKRAGCDLIPQNVLDKPPSAELRPGQKDEDSLPPYEVLDAILHMHLVERASPADITAAGFDYETVKHVLTLVERNEYKRRQAAVVLKVSRKAFGFGRQIPMARSLYEFS